MSKIAKRVVFFFIRVPEYVQNQSDECFRQLPPPTYSAPYPMSWNQNILESESASNSCISMLTRHCNSSHLSQGIFLPLWFYHMEKLAVTPMSLKVKGVVWMWVLPRMLMLMKRLIWSCANGSQSFVPCMWY